MATLSTAPAEVHELIGEVIREHHPDLAQAGVTVGALMAWAKSGDPVKLHGYPCAATVKKNSVRDRLEGKPDATITIDSDHWDGLDDRQRAALIDHELTHLVPVLIGTIEHKDSEGNVVEREPVWKTDDAGRPVLQMRLHDWQLGGFRAVAERHGSAAPEVREWQRANERFRQSVFAWSDDTVPADEPGDLAGALREAADHA